MQAMSTSALRYGGGHDAEALRAVGAQGSRRRRGDDPAAHLLWLTGGRLQKTQGSVPREGRSAASAAVGMPSSWSAVQ